jgi:hypothetical protein
MIRRDLAGCFVAGPGRPRRSGLERVSAPGQCRGYHPVLKIRGRERGDMGKPEPFQPRLRASVDAHKRHRLSHAHVQMARELGLNPAKLGNHQQEPWRAPLPLAVASGFLSNVRFSGDGRLPSGGRAAAIACGLERRGNHVVVDPCDIRAVPLRSSYGIG